MSTKKFNDSGKIYRFKVMQFDIWEQRVVPRPGAERPTGNPSVTAGGKERDHRQQQTTQTQRTQKRGEKSMTLAELSTEYEASAGLISGRLAELRLALRQEEDAETAVRLRRRIETLRPMLTQCRKLSHLTAHYYDPDFWRYGEYSL